MYVATGAVKRKRGWLPAALTVQPVQTVAPQRAPNAAGTGLQFRPSGWRPSRDAKVSTKLPTRVVKITQTQQTPPLYSVLLQVPANNNRQRMLLALLQVDVREGQTLTGDWTVIGKYDVRALYTITANWADRLPTPDEEARYSLPELRARGFFIYRFDWVGDKLNVYMHEDARRIIYMGVSERTTHTTGKIFDRWKATIQNRVTKAGWKGGWSTTVARLVQDGKRGKNIRHRSTKIYFGLKPFETFKDHNGKRWGFFYNRQSDQVTIERYTKKTSIWGKLGKLLKEAAGWVWKKVKSLFNTLCGFLTKGSSAEAVDAAKALAAASGNPTGMGVAAATEVAQAVCSGAASTPKTSPLTEMPVTGSPAWLIPAVIGIGGLGVYLMTRKK